MNFLNPLAFIGMAAAGIPLLLHLLNLRRLKTVEFSTLRFLQELQQTQVRRLKLQQLLLLILRTLLIIFAVLAFARPTVPSNLPLLSGNARSSVVILVDNSGSMEAADQRGQRLQQAKDHALKLLDLLTNGDEVCVLPTNGLDPLAPVGFTRTFAEARRQIESIALSPGSANYSLALQQANALFTEAANQHCETFLISDAQAVNRNRTSSDTGVVLKRDVTVFLMKIGDGLSGLEQNLSVDSVHMITKLPQVNRPVEVEAFIRNGSTTNATGVLVSMAVNRNRVTQRALDIPAGATRSIVLAAPIQRSGAMNVSVELEADALKSDNVRYLGLTIPPPARTAVVGDGLEAALVSTALSLQPVQQSITVAHKVPSFAAVAPFLQDVDVVFIAGGAVTASDVSLLRQFVERGGGLVVFANDDGVQAELLEQFGLHADGERSAPTGKPWTIRTVDDRSPLLEGVFKQEHDRRLVESPKILRQVMVSGGMSVLTSDVGPILSEGSLGSGRMLFYAMGADGSWGSLGSTGLFPATVVRSAIYLSSTRATGINVAVGEPFTIHVPSRYTGEATFTISDVLGARLTATPMQLANGSTIAVAGQPVPGVVTCNTVNGVGVSAIAVNAPTDESRLSFNDNDSWLQSVRALAMKPDHVVVATGRTVADAVRTARQGSELWPLCILLALLCGVSESLIARYGATERVAATA